MENRRSFASGRAAEAALLLGALLLPGCVVHGRCDDSGDGGVGVAFVESVAVPFLFGFAIGDAFDDDCGDGVRFRARRGRCR